MKSNIICHIDKQKYLFDISKNKYYVYKASKDMQAEVNITSLEKLKEIGKNLDWSIDDRYQDILDKTYEAHSMRKHYRFDLYQTPILPETAVRRALLIKEKNRKIIMIGDDDLVCVPLALLGHNITVLDADEYLLELISKINEKMNLNIKTINMNLLGKIHMEDEEKFDALFSDPISTYEGFEIFIGKGLQMLKSNGIAYVAVVDRLESILMEFCNDYDINIVNHYKRFCNSYNHKFEIIDDVSNMFILESTINTKYKYLLEQECNTDFFKSQHDMKYCVKTEYFDICKESIEYEINEVIELIKINGNFNFNISKLINNNNIYYLIYDHEDKIKIDITVYEFSRVSITLEYGVNCNIGSLKKKIAKTISHKSMRVNQFVCALSNISSRSEMDINYLY